ncbi:MAG: SDR family oxidoreductase [Kofleriaceae bacterium]|nr:SDR family oxidoreductase [Kofleriaceae bacterium]MBP9168879.1 SDR family oxidoreductase [Kofleriaceae bacterium]MBP9862127.1 SDR family oxidoreductase [Kofleriaceae bacterium]
MNQPSGRVHGKVALVTGAASGLGKAAARSLAREGATVILTDRDPGGAAVAADLGPPHRFEVLDVTDEARWAEVIAGVVAAHGRLDALVNSAGLGLWGDVEHTTLADFRLMYRVNVEGTFLGCRAALAAMTSGGSIINLSSVAGLIGVADLAGYCASKGAVRLLTKSIAMHAARAGRGVRCNSVHPSFIDTPMVDRMASVMGEPAAAKARLAQAAPLGRLGQADEVAAMIVYLASDESRFVTGAELVIDGGLTAR